MIPSSEAHFYLESRGDVYPHHQSKLIGRTIAVVLLPSYLKDSKEGTTTATGDDASKANAHIFSVGVSPHHISPVSSNSNSARRDDDADPDLRINTASSFDYQDAWPSFVAAKSCQLILKFSTASKVELGLHDDECKVSDGEHKNEEVMTGEQQQASKKKDHSCDRYKMALEEILGNVKIKPEYCVLDTSATGIMQENVEAFARCELQDAIYCTLGDIPRSSRSAYHRNANVPGCHDEDPEAGIKGYIFSVSRKGADNDNEYDSSSNNYINSFDQMDPIPTPLLSISLVQIEGRRLSTSSGGEETSGGSTKDKRSPLDTLLQQCLKRLLVNQLVVCQMSDHCTTNSSTTLKVFQSCQDIDVHADTNAHENHQSLISLSVPTLNGSKENFTYRVDEVIPHVKNPRRQQGRRGGPASSNIFMILPSTRITLNQSAQTRTPSSPGTRVLRESNLQSLQPNHELQQKPSTMDLILNTIFSIRYISTLRPKTREGSNEALYGLDVPRAFIISGPPGTGKTYSVRMAVEAANAQQHYRGGCGEEGEGGVSNATRLVSMRGSEILSIGTNEADAALELKRQFTQAAEFASKSPNNVSVIFMDECDALLSSDVAGATVGALLDQMSSSVPTYHADGGEEQKSLGYYRNVASGWKRMIVIAATNRIDAIPSSLRRPGRIDRELSISPPNAKERLKILKSLLNEIEQGRDFQIYDSDEDESKSINDTEILEIAELCVGYVASDLASLIRRAAFLSFSEGVAGITSKCLKDAMKDVGASALRDSAINAPPSTRWTDIAGDAGGAKVRF